MDELEQDDHNFSSSSSHRLPTVSGTQAIRDAVRSSLPISTGLSSLDKVLGSGKINNTAPNGLPRGIVTEICGPPGVGKTTFAMQLAVNALKLPDDQPCVTWIDTSSTINRQRFEQLLYVPHESSDDEHPLAPTTAQSTQNVDPKERIHYMQLTSLHKILALFLHASETFPPRNTRLIVLDDFSSLVLSSLPRTNAVPGNTGSQQTPIITRTDRLAKQLSIRRYHVLSTLASGLQNFAMKHNINIITTGKVTVNFRAGQRAVLRSALASQQWDNHLTARIILFRDVWSHESVSIYKSYGRDMHTKETLDIDIRKPMRCAQVVRLGGREVVSRRIDFVIEENGLREIQNVSSSHDMIVQPVATQQMSSLPDMLDDEDIEAEPDQTVGEDASSPGTILSVFSEDTRARGKRKAAEIADSGDEEDKDREDREDHEMTLPAEQAVSDEHEDTTECEDSESQHDAIFQTAKHIHSQEAITEGRKLRSGAVHHFGDAHVSNEAIESDEMLLDNHESQVPAFSQIAAEMSDPLTPSDDGMGYME